jgi:hypothetical protein
MPTILVIEGFRFYFYSNEGTEPAHVHVEKGDGTAKYWLQPVELVNSDGFTRAELRRAREIVEQNAADFIERWNEHFGRR